MYQMETKQAQKKSLLINHLVCDLPVNEQIELHNKCGYKSRQGFNRMMAASHRMPAEKLEVIRTYLDEKYQAKFTLDALIKPLADFINVE